MTEVKNKIIDNSLHLTSYNEADKKEGVYFLIKGNEIVYIGQAKNIKGRILQHSYDHRKNFNRFYFLEITCAKKRCANECFLITTINPKYNVYKKDYFTNPAYKLPAPHLEININPITDKTVK